MSDGCFAPRPTFIEIRRGVDLDPHEFDFMACPAKMQAEIKRSSGCSAGLL
jgi:hypothetical protein